MPNLENNPRDQRLYETPTRLTWRSEAERDSDRILYAPEFRRLGRVTQVAPNDEIAVLHDRFSHSLKVAQIGFRSAQSLLADVGNEDDEDMALTDLLDPHVVYAAGLAHDIGHPPFGHIGEKALQAAARSRPRALTELIERDDMARVGHFDAQKAATLLVGESAIRRDSNESKIAIQELAQRLGETADEFLPDGFEGNAQTLRIVSKLSYRGTVRTGETDVRGLVGARGLDLTRATLAAIMKYPWMRHDNPTVAGVAADGSPLTKEEKKHFEDKWGVYLTEVSTLRFVQRSAIPGRLRTLEAQMMDWADDITYAVHDVEDFYRCGLIPLHDIATAALGDPANNYSFEAFVTYARANVERSGVELPPVFNPFKEWAKHLPVEQYAHTPLLRTQTNDFVSWAVTYLQEEMRVDDGVLLDPGADRRMVAELLKQLTWYFVIDDPQLASVQQGQGRIVQELYDMLYAWALIEFPIRYGGIEVSITRAPRRLPARLSTMIGVAQADKWTQKIYQSPYRVLARSVIDYIASLTEEQVYDMHSRLAGGEVHPIVRSWF